MSRSEWKPREPPTFSGRLKEDVHQWTAIVTQYFTLVPGTDQQQLTYAVSLLRGTAIEWYNAEVKKDNPTDWKSLSEALILRFGSTARSKRALLKIMQLKQDKDDVLQYAAKFESLKAQMETYDEQMLLMRFIFGLKEDLIEPVFMQYPKTVQEAKQVAENIEIVHQGVERHEKFKTAKGKNQTSNKKQGKKGILGNVSVVRGQYSNQSAGFKMRSRKTRSSFAQVSCNISRSVNQKSVHHSLFSRPPVQKGTILGSSDSKCAAAKWREFIRPLSHRDRAGVWRSYVKKRGSIVVADLEALTCAKEVKTAVIDAGKKQYRKSSNDQSSSDIQRTRSTRSHQSNRLLRREKERMVREQVRERRIVARLLATRVSPSDGGQSGGTGLRTTVTTSALQDWSSTEMKRIEPGHGEEKTSQKQLTSVAVHQSIDREISDGILLVVPVRIQGREYRALIDSGATRSFISPACITETGSKTRKNNTFLELGNGSKVLSKFEAMDIPVVIAGRTFRIDFTVSDLLHNVDIVLGITWLKKYNPLVDWSTGNLYILDSHSLMRLFGEWLEAKYKIGTVKLLYSHEDIEALKNPAVTDKIAVIANPRFWQFENCRGSFSFKGDEKWKKTYCTLRIDRPVACTMKVKRLVNHAKLPIRGSTGAAGYDLHAAEKCVPYQQMHEA